METASPSLSPADIDASFVARLVPELEVVSIGDEQIVVGDETGVVALNATGALIFGFLDGTTTLGELVEDFAAVLDVDPDIVEHDVLEFVRHLGANGLLEGVGLPPPEAPDAWDTTPAVEVGDEVADFTLPDLDGGSRALSEFRGTRTLLVNWSPGCGFCVTIANELAALDPLLAARDVSLVLIAGGDVDSNRSVNEDAGLGAVTLLRDGTDVDPFSGTGTPAALLLDADGTLSESMSVGALQVPMLARDLAGLDPATPFGVPADDATVDDEELDGDVRGTYLPAPGAMCGPGGGGGGSNSTQWVGTRAYAMGGYHVGLQYDGPETAAVLDRFFADAHVHDRRVPDNYSVALGSTPTTKGAGASRSLKLLVRGGRQLVRSRSGGRVLAALLQYLSADLEPADPSLVEVSATAVVRDGEALLLPPGLGDHVKVLQPRLAKRGMTLVDTPRTLLDLDRRTLVVPDPVVDFDATVIDDVDADVKLGSELPWIPPGRYPLGGWYFARVPDEIGSLSPAAAVTSALPMLHGDDDGDVRVRIDRLAGLLSSIGGYGIWYESADDLVAQVDAARS